jgi:hypothetical protein
VYLSNAEARCNTYVLSNKASFIFLNKLIDRNLLFFIQDAFI